MKLTIKVTAQIEQIDNLVKKLSEISEYRPDLEFTVDFMVSDKTEVNIDGTLERDSPNLYKCISSLHGQNQKAGDWKSERGHC